MWIEFKDYQEKAIVKLKNNVNDLSNTDDKNKQYIISFGMSEM